MLATRQHRTDWGVVGNPGWKKFERRVARDHGCERQPITGERDASDATEHPMFCFQMKLRKCIPKTIREWSDSIHRSAQKVNKVGVLIVKEPGKHDDNALVILRYSDWIDLHRHLSGVLSKRDTAALLDAMANPPEPPPALIAAGKRHGSPSQTPEA